MVWADFEIRGLSEEVRFKLHSFFVNVWTELSNQFWHFWGNPGELTFVIVILTFMDYVEPYHTASWPDRYRPSQEITNLQWLLWGLAWTLRN